MWCEVCLKGNCISLSGFYCVRYLMSGDKKFTVLIIWNKNLYIYSLSRIVLRQVCSVFQEFSRNCNVAFSLSNSSIFFSLRSPSSRLNLLLRFLFPSVFPSVTCFRRLFLRKIWPIKLAFVLYNAGNYARGQLYQVNVLSLCLIFQSPFQ